VKILIVDDHPLVREGLREHLQQLGPSIEFHEASSEQEALALADSHPDLDLVLLDLKLPDARGLSALSALRERHPAIPVVVLSAEMGRDVVLAVRDKGASGFIPKTDSTQIIVDALRLVLSGGVYLPSDILNSSADSGSPNSEFSLQTKTAEELGLTPRQTQILALLAQGKPNKIICRELGLAESTVKIHMTAILKALNVTNRVQAVIAVGRLGLRLSGTNKNLDNN
jgi:DNA-binding NarL/FixJ family response regulator